MREGTHLRGPDGVCSPNCFPCKIKTVGIAPSAMPTRNPTAARAKTKDPLLATDRDAYKRLRMNGQQPKHIEGSAALEAQANESFEISHGQIEPDPVRRARIARGLADLPAASSAPANPELGQHVREHRAKAKA